MTTHKMTNRSDFFISQSPSDDEEFPYWVPQDYLRRKFTLANASIRDFQSSSRSQQQTGLTRNPALDRSLIQLVEQYGRGDDGLRTIHVSGNGNRVKSLLNQQHWKSISREINTGISPRQCEERYLQLIEAAKVHRQGSTDIKSVYGSYLISSEPVAASRNVRSRNARPIQNMQTERSSASVKKADVATAGAGSTKSSEVTEIASVLPTLKRSYNSTAPVKQSKRLSFPPSNSIFQALQKAQQVEIKSRKVVARAHKVTTQKRKVQQSADDIASIDSYSSEHSSDIRSDDSIFDTSSSEESEYEEFESDGDEQAADAVGVDDRLQSQQKEGDDMPDTQKEGTAYADIALMGVNPQRSAEPALGGTGADVAAVPMGATLRAESVLTVEAPVVDLTESPLNQRASQPDVVDLTENEGTHSQSGLPVVAALSADVTAAAALVPPLTEFASESGQQGHQGQQIAETEYRDDVSMGGSSLHSLQSADSQLDGSGIDGDGSDSGGSLSDLESLCSVIIADADAHADAHADSADEERVHKRRRLSPDGIHDASARASPVIAESTAVAAEVEHCSTLADANAVELLLELGASVQAPTPLENSTEHANTTAVDGAPTGTSTVHTLQSISASPELTATVVPTVKAAATVGDVYAVVDMLDQPAPSSVPPEQSSGKTDGATSNDGDPIASSSPIVEADNVPELSPDLSGRSQRHEDSIPSSSSADVAKSVAQTDAGACVDDVLGSVLAATVDLLRAMLPRGRYHRKDVDWNSLCSVLQLPAQKCQEIAKALRWKARERAEKRLNAAREETEKQRKRRLRRCPAKRPKHSSDPRSIKIPPKRAAALAAEKAAAAAANEKASIEVTATTVAADAPAGIFHHALLQGFLGASVDAVLHKQEPVGTPCSSSSSAQGVIEQPVGDDTDVMIVVQELESTAAVSSSGPAPLDPKHEVVSAETTDWHTADQVSVVAVPSAAPLSPPATTDTSDAAQRASRTLCSPHIDVAAVAQAIHCAATEIFTGHTTMVHSTAAVPAGQSMPSVTAHPIEFAAPSPPPMYTLPPIASTIASAAAAAVSVIPNAPARRPPATVHRYRALIPLPISCRTPLDERLLAAVKACSQGRPLVGPDTLPLTPALWETISKGLQKESSFCIARYLILTGRTPSLSPYYVAPPLCTTVATAYASAAQLAAVGLQKGPRPGTSVQPRTKYGSYDELMLAILSFARRLQACTTVDAAQAILDEAESDGISPAQLARTTINMTSVNAKPAISDPQLQVFGTNLAPLRQIANKDDRLFAAMKLHRFNNLPCSLQANAIIAELRQGKHFKLVTVQNFGQPLTALQWGTLGGLVDLDATQCQSRYWRLLALKLRTREITLHDLRCQATRSGAAIATFFATSSNAAVTTSSVPAQVTPPVPTALPVPAVLAAPIGVQRGVYAPSVPTQGVKLVHSTMHTAPIRAPNALLAPLGPIRGASTLAPTVQSKMMNIYDKFVTASATSRSEASTGGGGDGGLTGPSTAAAVDAAVYGHFADYIHPSQASIPVTQGDLGMLSEASDTPARKRARVSDTVTDVAMSLTSTLPAVGSPTGDQAEYEYSTSEVMD